MYLRFFNTEKHTWDMDRMDSRKYFINYSVFDSFVFY